MHAHDTMSTLTDASTSAPPQAYVNLQKHRTGIDRLAHAGLHSLAGFRVAWREQAFRQEVGLLVITTPMALWIGQSWVEMALLIGVTLVLLMVELLNTGIEITVDRVGMEWHPLSKAAKDVGSAAVLVACLAWFAVWAAAVVGRLSA